MSARSHVMMYACVYAAAQCLRRGLSVFLGVCTCMYVMKYACISRCETSMFDACVRVYLHLWVYVRECVEP